MKRDDDPSRLADHTGLDPWIAGLLRSTEPYKVQPGRKQRVLLGFGRQEPRRTPRFLRLTIVVGVLVAGGAFASAAIGPWRGWRTSIFRAYERVVSSSSHAPVAVVERAREHRAVAVQESESVAPSVQPAPKPLVTTGPPPNRELVAPARPHRAAAVASAPAPQGEQDTQVVMEGMRALRLDRDPVRARVLLARYLDRHPNGALAEEALALSIEAAVAHHDTDAAALAAHYLRRYPAGPFCALARDAQR